jgi:hypothetical protein
MGVGNASGTGDPVVDGITVDVNVGTLVTEGVGNDVLVGTGVAVSGREVDEAGTIVGLALSVVEEVKGSGVNVAVGFG